MKMLKKVLGFALAFCMLFSVTACTPKGDDAYSETVLRVGVWDGGLGHVWIEKVAAEFEKKYADVSFEEGKTGVKVLLAPSKDNAGKISTAIDMNQNAEDVYFTCYYTGTEYVLQNRSLNITDAVTQKVYLDNGELADMEWDAATGKLKLKAGATEPTKSIADKMTENNRDGYYTSTEKLGNREGYAAGYYALPFENSLSGFIYDYDLFKSHGWLNYDGIDGLPGTMTDFWDLLNRIKEAGIIPFTFSRATSEYWSGLSDAFLAQYEGHENAELDYKLSGTYTFPAGTYTQAECADDEYLTYNPDGTATGRITQDSGYLLARTPGKAKFVEFIRTLFSSDYYDPDIYTSLYDENYKLPAQRFILNSTLGQTPIAMLYEGEWWENENRSQFNYTTEGFGKHDYRFFPLPKIDGQKTDQYTIADYSRGVDLFVNAKTKKAEVAKLFLQFVHSESSLETFTLETGITRMYEYDLSAEQQSTLSKFAQNTYKIKKTNTSGVTVTASRAKLVADPFWSVLSMGYGGSVASRAQDARPENQPCYFFSENTGKDGRDYVSAETFIEGMKTVYGKTNWTDKLNEWKNK